MINKISDFKKKKKLIIIKLSSKYLLSIWEEVMWP
jgi:hypothetical protein